MLDGVDLEVAEGTVFSPLGPNGAGKTTAVKILSTLISAGPESGGIRVGGHDLAADPPAVRAAIGVTGQFSAVDGLITGEENMLLMAACTICPGRRAGGSPTNCWVVSVWCRPAPGAAGRPGPARRGGAGRGVLAPQVVDEGASLHRAAGGEREPGEEHPQPGAGDVDRHATV